MLEDLLTETKQLRENTKENTRMIPGIPTQTLFNPLENYPPGVLRSVAIQLPGTGETLDIQFFPECQEIVFAMDNRTPDKSVRDERMRRWNCSRIDRDVDSWSLDEISSEKTKWKKGKLQVEWNRDKCELMKGDIAKIEEMSKDYFEFWMRDYEHFGLWYATQMFMEFQHDHPGFEKEEDEWVNTHTFSEEEEEFFEKEITDMNLHHLRSSAGPPTGEYYMNISYDPNTGLPDKNKRSGCWRYEEWCPELGRLSLISLPEDYGCFSTFNTDFKPVGIQWPKEIVEKSEGECNEKRFSGLKSCGSWMEPELDNEGRYVANGFVKKVGRGNCYGGIVSTEFGECMVQHEYVLKHDLKGGEEVKLLCKDNDILQDWATPIKCLKVLMKGPGVHKEFADCGWY